MRQRYVYQIVGETDCGPATACVVADSEIAAAQYVREQLEFVLVQSIRKDAICWIA